MVSVNDAMEHANVSIEYLNSNQIFVFNTNIYDNLRGSSILEKSHNILIFIRLAVPATSTSGKELKIEENSAHEDPCKSSKLKFEA